MPTSKVVSYRNSTSNHNKDSPLYPIFELYLIEILHQTTTGRLNSVGRRSCILSKFYIKPQLDVANIVVSHVVSYRNSTSNHNKQRSHTAVSDVVSYRNSTSNHNPNAAKRASAPSCILSKFYIKPQLKTSSESLETVVSYRNSTSNHNPLAILVPITLLYLIEILHQTTTTEAVTTSDS